jgi:ketosteroid isomerase-like protein
MKKIRTLAACMAAAAAIGAVAVFALPHTASADTTAVQAEIKAADDAYWKAYNNCDYKVLDALTAEDVEFYHDLGGITHGRADLTGSVRDNICSDKEASVRRDVKPDETQTFLLRRGNEVYAALLTGQHHFFRVMKANGAAVPTGNARFSMLWRKQDTGWKLSRVMSYDHQPVAQGGERKVVQLSAADLDSYAGRYAAKIQPVLVFQRAGDNLSVEVGGNAVTLYPMSATKFFMKERDIVVDFKTAANGKSPGFVVLENGAPVDEGTRQ